MKKYLNLNLYVSKLVFFTWKLVMVSAEVYALWVLFWFIIISHILKQTYGGTAQYLVVQMSLLDYTPGQNLKTIWKNLNNHIMRRNIVNTLLEDVWKTKTKHTTKWQQHTKNIYCVRGLKLKKPILPLVKSLRPSSKKWHIWYTKSYNDLFTITWVSTVTIPVYSMKIWFWCT